MSHKLPFGIFDLRNNKIYINYRINEYFKNFRSIKEYATYEEKKKLIQILTLSKYLYEVDCDAINLYNEVTVLELLGEYRKSLINKYRNISSICYKV